MRRRSFIGLLLGGVVATLTKVEFTFAFPFVRRKPIVPRCREALTTSGTADEVTFLLPDTQKDDVIVLMLAAVHKTRLQYYPKSRLGWTLLSTQQFSPYVQYTWYVKADRDMPRETVRFQLDQLPVGYSIVATAFTGEEVDQSQVGRRWY